MNENFPEPSAWDAVLFRVEPHPAELLPERDEIFKNS